MSSKHLIVLRNTYGLFTLSLIGFNYLYCSQIIPPLSSHLTHFLFHSYLILSGFHILYPILKSKSTFEKISHLIASLISFLPMFLFLYPLQVSILNIFYENHGILPIGTKYAFVYRLFTSMAVCIWSLLINLQSSLLMSFLIVLSPRPQLSLTWFTYLCFCLFLEGLPELFPNSGIRILS